MLWFSPWLTTFMTKVRILMWLESRSGIDECVTCLLQIRIGQTMITQLITFLTISCFNTVPGLEIHTPEWVSSMHCTFYTCQTTTGDQWITLENGSPVKWSPFNSGIFNATFIWCYQHSKAHARVTQCTKVRQRTFACHIICHD